MKQYQARCVSELIAGGIAAVGENNPLGPVMLDNGQTAARFRAVLVVENLQQRQAGLELDRGGKP